VRGRRAIGMGDGEAAVPSRFRTVCVFCGSNAGRRKVYADAALELGHELVSVHVRAGRGRKVRELSSADHARPSVRHALRHCHRRPL
jgi:hypothetical protein